MLHVSVHIYLVRYSSLAEPLLLYVPRVEEQHELK